MATHILGIRHHGPGSCRNVLSYLQELKPDLILLEGPAEAEALVQCVIHPQLKPPVALLAYQPNEPHNATFYPFAEFSPEWQTLRYAMKNEIPLRFFDLPLCHSMAFKDKEEDENITKDTTACGDPFDHLAHVAGYSDGESWWEAQIEHRQDKANIFEAVKEAVTALREEFQAYTSAKDLLREAWMRKILRAAQKENFEHIAVICGAWHVPALSNMPKQKEDNELLKGLPKIKIECTWIPWTYDRLTFKSGYGAGIQSPGWYDYLWHYPEDDGTLWISQAAALFRQKNMDISVAHVIETIRLAQATAALRNLPHPSLNEFNEAITSVMGFGDNILLKIIKEELIVSNRLGSVPDDIPKVPLLVDVEKVQKRLRIPFTAEIKELILDLRKPNELERSIFFHRLHLLNIDWAIPTHIDGKGTFKEKWTLYHKPEQIVSIIEMAIWGNTLSEAVQNYLLKQMSEIQRIPELTNLLNYVVPANLMELVKAMTTQLDCLSAASTDILEMMEAVPSLANVVRYGNVRELDFSQINLMLNAMIARILAGGILVCINIDEEAATDILEKLISTDYAISILNDEELKAMWLEFIRQIRNSANVHPLLSGYATHLLNDKGDISYEEMENTLSFYSSAGNVPTDMAYWFEGFLHSSGSVLLLDDNLWKMVSNWISAQTKEDFMQLLPILKRTFSQFTISERRKLGEKAKTNGSDKIQQQMIIDTTLIDKEAIRVIPVIRQLLGIEIK